MGGRVVFDKKESYIEGWAPEYRQITGRQTVQTDDVGAQGAGAIKFSDVPLFSRAG